MPRRIEWRKRTKQHCFSFSPAGKVHYQKNFPVLPEAEMVRKRLLKFHTASKQRRVGKKQVIKSSPNWARDRRLRKKSRKAARSWDKK